MLSVWLRGLGGGWLTSIVCIGADSYHTGQRDSQRRETFSNGFLYFRLRLSLSIDDLKNPPLFSPFHTRSLLSVRGIKAEMVHRFPSCLCPCMSLWSLLQRSAHNPRYVQTKTAFFHISGLIFKTSSSDQEKLPICWWKCLALLLYNPFFPYVMF